MSYDAKNPPLRELAAAHGRGVLTPFTGSGISLGPCPDWKQMVRALELSAGIESGGADDSAALVRRASRATQVLRLRSPGALERAVREAIYGAAAPDGVGLAPPAATEALSAIWWPLVLTTNYDSLFLNAWNRVWLEKEPLPDFGRMLPVGRGRVDCQRVLNATRSPDNPLLWGLQGFLGSGDTARLAAEITIGHEEYRRQTHEAVHFRRAFAEIYRSRTLLFLGSGLSESYLLDLFGEALELLGTIPHFHYAFIPRGSADPDFLERRLQILAIEYDRDAPPGHGAVATFIRQLKKAIDGPRPRRSRWGMALAAPSEVRTAEPGSDVEVIRMGLPKPDSTRAAAGADAATSDGPRAAIAASAGFDKGRLLPGKTAEDLAEHLGYGRRPQNWPLHRIGETHVWRLADEPVFIVAARNLALNRRDARDVRSVAPATVELMQAAAAAGFDRVDAMLLASGQWRTFPQYVTLTEMVRGYCHWRSSPKAARRLPLHIYTVDPAVTGLLEAGRIDLMSMVDAARVRFWIELRMGDDSPAPMLALAEPDATVAMLMTRYAIPAGGWTMHVRPAPQRETMPEPTEKLAVDSRTIAEAGVIDGSTVIFTRLNCSTPGPL